MASRVRCKVHPQTEFRCDFISSLVKSNTGASAAHIVDGHAEGHVAIGGIAQENAVQAHFRAFCAIDGLAGLHIKGCAQS